MANKINKTASDGTPLSPCGVERNQEDPAPTLPNQEPITVAIVYHFLPHYRAGIFLELQKSTKYNYIFVAGHNNLNPTIPEWRVTDPARSIEARCTWMRKPWFFQRGLAKVALRRDIRAIIYLGTPYSVSVWYSAILGRLSGKRILFWTHGWLKKKDWIREVIKKRFFGLAHTILLYGEHAKSIGEEMGFSPERMVVIYNSLNYVQQVGIRDAIRDEELIELRLRMFGDSTTPYAICVARLTPECEFGLLLSAQHLLRTRNKVVNLVLVGEGPKRQELEDFAKKESLPVLFMGSCYDEEMVARLVRAANVTVSPGKVGLTAIHSLTYGTPVISHDDLDRQMPEVEAIVPGRNGDLFCRGDAEDLARVLTRVMHSYG